MMFFPFGENGREQNESESKGTRPKPHLIVTNNKTLLYIRGNETQKMD